MSPPVIRVTLEVHVPEAAGDLSDLLSLDEIVAGIEAVPNVSSVVVAGEFDVTRCIDVHVDISGYKKERCAAHRSIMRLFDRHKNQLRRQSYDLLAMHGE